MPGRVYTYIHTHIHTYITCLPTCLQSYKLRSSHIVWECIDPLFLLDLLFISSCVTGTDVYNQDLEIGVGSGSDLTWSRLKPRLLLIWSSIRFRFFFDFGFDFTSILPFLHLASARSFHAHLFENPTHWEIWLHKIHLSILDEVTIPASFAANGWGVQIKQDKKEWLASSFISRSRSISYPGIFYPARYLSTQVS